MCLSNFKAIRQFKVPISWLWDFTRSYDKTSFRILRRGPGSLYHQLTGSHNIQVYYMASEILVNIVSGNDLLPEGIKHKLNKKSPKKLNKWLTIKKLLWHASHCNAYLNAQDINVCGIHSFEIKPTFLRVQTIKWDYYLFFSDWFWISNITICSWSHRMGIALSAVSLTDNWALCIATMDFFYGCTFHFI